MFFKILINVLIFVLLTINTKCFCDSSQLTQDLNLNSSQTNHSSNDKPFETTGDLQAKNGTNETTVNETVIESMVINDLPAVPTPSPPNEMLSFEEWRKKIAEKAVNLEPPSPKITSQVRPESQQSAPTVVQSPAPPKQKPIVKRARNFASYECGAKVVDSNPESESVQRILNEQTDEYMLNPCKTNIWFVLELCETIQPKTIEIANFELYSSVPKEFAIEASDHYPTREWSQLGTFNASDERSVQRFQLQNNGFVKFVRIEMLSHYGSEHFCPLSVVRVFGTSLFEEVERIDNMDTNHNIADEESESTITEELVGEADSSQNLFGTARDAVFNIVKKAAQALNGNNNEVQENSPNATDSSTMKSLTQLESIAIQLFPKVDKYLHNCSKTTNNSVNCCYLKSLFGQPLYELLIDHSFNCYVTNPSTNKTQIECTSDPKNSTNESIKIDSSVDVNNFENISPTKPILNEFVSKLIENNSSIDSNSVFVDTIKSIPSQTLSEDTSPSIESSVMSTIVSESIASSDKSEELSTVSVISQNEVTTESENPVIKIEDLNKNVTTNETIAKNSQLSSQQQQNGGSNGYITTGSAQSKESVVIRLSNRIKALEVNLSLSSQYLEELSLRYRKQMEEMQRAFNITISKLNDTNIRAAERDLKQQESIAFLENKLNALNTQMSVLLAERESLNWHYIEVHIALMMIEVIVVIVFLLICVNRLSQRINFIQINESLKDLSLKTAQNSVSPHKRSHPNPTPYHLPPKTLKIEGEDKSLDLGTNSSNSKVICNQRKIRKKKKKMNALNGIHMSNSLESDAFVLNENKTNKLKDISNQSLISKSQSTPVLAIRSQSQPNGNLLNLSDNSCHSSTSGVSSTSGLSNVFTNRQNIEIKANNKKSLNDKINRKISSDNKSNSLTHSLKKLLKFERK